VSKRTPFLLNPSIEPASLVGVQNFEPQKAKGGNRKSQIVLAAGISTHPHTIQLTSSYVALSRPQKRCETTRLSAINRIGGKCESKHILGHVGTGNVGH
jgi:hypothetical protein